MPRSADNARVAFDEPADLIASCEATLDTLGLLMGDINEEIQDSGESWTIAQILNHLLDTERRYLARVGRVHREHHPHMRVMPDADYTRLSALKAWTQFYDLRRRQVRLLKQLKADDWRRSGTLAPVGRVTIASLVRHLVAHDAAHTAQIARRLSGRRD
jgi:uncharacterized damage-inducible protein DinB